MRLCRSDEITYIHCLENLSEQINEYENITAKFSKFLSKIQETKRL